MDAVRPEILKLSPTLLSLGYTPSWAAAFAASAVPGTIPGRVSHVHRGQVDVLCELGSLRIAVPSSLSGPQGPATGDWVALQPAGGPSDLGVLRSILPRTSEFRRRTSGRQFANQVVAANLDTVFIVVSVNGDMSAARVDRYLAAVQASGARAVVVYTKVDLSPDVRLPVVTAVPMVAVSALTGRGLANLQPWLMPGATVALVGSSGTGKSTLANALAGAQIMDTGGIRAHDDRGKHTTTVRALIPLPSGACLVDTPGMRELALAVDGGSVAEAFSDVTAFAAQCRFRNCSHDDEPGCAVLAAIADGELSERRLQSLRKLEREQAFAKRRENVKQRRRYERTRSAEVRRHQHETSPNKRR